MDFANAEVLTTALSGAVESTIIKIANVLPGILAAVIIFLLGWIVSIILSRVFRKILEALKLENLLKEHKVDDALGSVRISDVLVKLFKYYIILIFLQAAVSFLELGTITVFLTSVLVYMPVLIAAIMIVLASVILGEYLRESVIELKSKSSLVNLTGRAVKWVIIYVGITMALSTAGIDTTLITSIFITVLQAMAFGIALAVGIAFGFGGQDDAKSMLGKWRKHLKV